MWPHVFRHLYSVRKGVCVCIYIYIYVYIYISNYASKVKAGMTQCQVKFHASNHVLFCKACNFELLPPRDKQKFGFISTIPHKAKKKPKGATHRETQTICWNGLAHHEIIAWCISSHNPKNTPTPIQTHLHCCQTTTESLSCLQHSNWTQTSWELIA